VLDEGRITIVDERAVSDRVEVLARDEVPRRAHDREPVAPPALTGPR
jgi:hypothetical protein